MKNECIFGQPANRSGEGEFLRYSALQGKKGGIVKGGPDAEILNMGIETSRAWAIASGGVESGRGNPQHGD
jgi:hypothetical protein